MHSAIVSARIPSVRRAFSNPFAPAVVSYQSKTDIGSHDTSHA